MTRPASGTRPVALLVTAHAISQVGTYMASVAVPWFVLTTTGSASQMGLVMAVFVLPIAVLGIPAGTVIDRLGPRRVMLTADACRIVLSAAIPALYSVHLLSFPILLVISLLQGCFATVYGPSQRLVLPHLVGEDERAVGQANGLLQGADRVSGLGGPVLAGVLIALLGTSQVLYLDALTYAVSLSLLLPALPHMAVTRTEGGERPRLLDGLRYILRSPLLGPLAGSVTILDTAFAAMMAALPVLVIFRYGGDPRLVGIFLSAFSGGAVAGTGLLMLAQRRFTPLALAGVGMPAMVVPLWTLVADVPWPAIAAALLLSGIANAFVSAPLYTAVTMRVPPAVRNQVMTTVNAVLTTAGPAGLAVTGRALDTLGVSRVLVVLALLVSAAAAVATATIQNTRRLDARRRPAGASPTTSETPS